MSSVVLRAVTPADVDALRQATTRAFKDVQRAIAEGSDVVMVVPSEDLLGHRSPEQAAYVGALVGITRAVAFEGARTGWKINAVAVPADMELSDEAAVAAVSTDGLTGQVLTLGTSLVGKVIP